MANKVELAVFVLKSYANELKCLSRSGSRVIERAVGEWRQRSSLAFVLVRTFFTHAVIKMMWC